MTYGEFLMSVSRVSFLTEALNGPYVECEYEEVCKDIRKEKERQRIYWQG